MGAPGFSVIPDYLVQYSQTVGAVTGAAHAAADTARNTGTGGLDIYGALPSIIVLPLMYAMFGSTSDSIASAADLGDRAVDRLHATADTYSAAESNLLSKLVELSDIETQTTTAAQAAAAGQVQRPLHADGGGNIDDTWQFGTDVYNLLSGKGNAAEVAGATALDAFGVGLDALGFSWDPTGSLYSIGLGWLIEQIPILRVPVDDLVGDPDAIKALANTWSDLSGVLKDLPTELSSALQVISMWQGPAADMYRALEAQYEQAFAGLSDHCESVAEMVTIIGAFVGQIRATAINMLADFVLWAVITMTAGTAFSFLTFGASADAAILSVSVEGEVTGAKLALLIGQLTLKLMQAGLAMQSLRENAEQSASMMHQVISGTPVTSQ